MNKTLVVIPYCSAGAQGRELECAVAGWRKHFKEDFLIVLAGENHPISQSGPDITCVESKRVEPVFGQYRQHLDYVSCLRKVHDRFPESNGYIIVADDCYAVNDFDLVDVRFLKAVSEEIFRVANPFNGWEVDKVKTRWALQQRGLPIVNYTTHLPEWYEWDLVERIWDEYQMDRVSYTIEDLYYNTYFKDRRPYILSKSDNLQEYIDKESFDESAFDRKIWITNTPAGWSSHLEEQLIKHYGI